MELRLHGPVLRLYIVSLCIVRSRHVPYCTDNADTDFFVRHAHSSNTGTHYFSDLLSGALNGCSGHPDDTLWVTCFTRNLRQDCFDFPCDCNTFVSRVDIYCRASWQRQEVAHSADSESSLSRCDEVASDAYSCGANQRLSSSTILTHVSADLSWNSLTTTHVYGSSSVYDWKLTIKARNDRANSRENFCLDSRCSGRLGVKNDLRRKSSSHS